MNFRNVKETKNAYHLESGILLDNGPVLFLSHKNPKNPFTDYDSKSIDYFRLFNPLSFQMEMSITVNNSISGYCQLSNGNIIYFTYKSEIGIIKTKNHSFSIAKEPSVKLSEYDGYDTVYLLPDSRFFIIEGSGLITIYKSYLDEVKIQAIMKTYSIDTPDAWYEDIKKIY